MSCCSSLRRNAAQSAFRPVIVEQPRARPQEPAQFLRYLGPHALTLKGPQSRKLYRLGPANRLVTVEVADAPALLRSGLFEAV